MTLAEREVKYVRVRKKTEPTQSQILRIVLLEEKKKPKATVHYLAKVRTGSCFTLVYNYKTLRDGFCFCV